MLTDQLRCLVLVSDFWRLVNQRSRVLNRVLCTRAEQLRTLCLLLRFNSADCSAFFPRRKQRNREKIFLRAPEEARVYRPPTSHRTEADRDQTRGEQPLPFRWRSSKTGRHKHGAEKTVPVQKLEMQFTPLDGSVSVIPNSSRASLRIPAKGNSPRSSLPPTPLIFPAPSPRFFRIIKIRPFSRTKHKVANSRGCHDDQSVIFAPPCGHRISSAPARAPSFGGTAGRNPR